MLDGLVQIGRRSSGSGAGLREAPTSLVETTRWDAVRPRFATVYVENKCHLKCEHCYESEQSHPHDARMSLADYAKLFDELAELGVLYLSLTGGEIFLRGDILDIIALARARRFAVRLYTSGTLIDEARADRIAALKVSEVQVSLYSADPSVHDGFVGQPASPGRDGAHAKTMRALGLLRERGVLTVVKSPAMTFNIDALEELAALAESVGADFRVDPNLHPRMNGDPVPLRYLVPPDQLKKKLLANPRLHAAFDGGDAERMCNGEAARADGGSICAAGREVISIGADGGVLPCASFPVAAGNARERSVVDIWRRAKLLDDVRSTTFGDMTACGSCAVKSTCDPCMAYALIENGDHHQCNAASLNLATAVRGLAEDRRRLDARAARGRALPLVGSACAAPPETRGCGCGG